ncbi:MAG: hypothetical protein NTW32_14565 [Chloroflexi bacterium]|nr:hypothetical protein [Chloroflexota bacterium]
MSNGLPPMETNSKYVARERVRMGLLTNVVGLFILVFSAKPEWFGLDRSPVIGFVQITIFLIGLAFLCLGGYISLAALWGDEEKTITADIGIRLISTGYVIALFSGMADVFGMTVQQTAKQLFFGPWQEAGMEVGMLIIAAGVLMIIPYNHLWKNK